MIFIHYTSLGGLLKFLHYSGLDHADTGLLFFFLRGYCTGFVYAENSLVATARFQAAAAIREAAIREWGFLNVDDKRSLIRSA